MSFVVLGVDFPENCYSCPFRDMEMDCCQALDNEFGRKQIPSKYLYYEGKLPECPCREFLPEPGIEVKA